MKIFPKLLATSAQITFKKPLQAKKSSKSMNGWNAEQVDVTITDDLLGGSYVLTARYFTEATEGHGARFTDMVSTFKAVTSADVAAMPTYLVELYKTISPFTQAFFTDNTSEMNDVLVQDAQIYTYDTDITDGVFILQVLKNKFRILVADEVGSEMIIIAHVG